MSHDPSRGRPAIIGSIDIVQPSYHVPLASARSHDSDLGALLRQLLVGQDRQNELLEELIGQIGANQRQKATELGQWKKANPRLARNCRKAAEGLSKIQAEFLDKLTHEISESYENLLEGEFALTEFIDRFGPRMAHLNGILQVLSQLSAVPNPATAQNSP